MSELITAHGYHGIDWDTGKPMVSTLTATPEVIKALQDQAAQFRHLRDTTRPMCLVNIRGETWCMPKPPSRSELCPCGSDARLKFKRCCGLLTQHYQADWPRYTSES